MDVLQTVNTGALPNDGTGDKFRDAFEKLNTNDALLGRQIAAILGNADPDLDSLEKIARVIREFYVAVNAVPPLVTIQQTVTNAIASVVNTVPTPAVINDTITQAIAQAVATQLAFIANGPVTSVNGRGGAVTVREITTDQSAAIAANTTAVAALTTAVADNKRLASLAIALGG